jgi:hypothetical protein
VQCIWSEVTGQKSPRRVTLGWAEFRWSLLLLPNRHDPTGYDPGLHRTVPADAFDPDGNWRSSTQLVQHVVKRLNVLTAVHRTKGTVLWPDRPLRSMFHPGLRCAAVEVETVWFVRSGAFQRGRFPEKWLRALPDFYLRRVLVDSDFVDESRRKRLRYLSDRCSR